MSTEIWRATFYEDKEITDETCALFVKTNESEVGTLEPQPLRERAVSE